MLYHSWYWSTQSSIRIVLVSSFSQIWTILIASFARVWFLQSQFRMYSNVLDKNMKNSNTMMWSNSMIWFCEQYSSFSIPLVLLCFFPYIYFDIISFAAITSKIPATWLSSSLNHWLVIWYFAKFILFFNLIR